MGTISRTTSWRHSEISEDCPGALRSLHAWQGDDPEGADDQQEKGNGQHTDSRHQDLKTLTESRQQENHRQEDGCLHILVASLPRAYALLEVGPCLLGKFVELLSIRVRVLWHEDRTGRRGEAFQRIKFPPS